MIRFSFSSLYMSFLFANAMIIFLYLAFRNQKLMMKLGLPILGGALSVTILRMLLPIEFLHLSHNINLPNPISMVISKFLYPRFLGNRFSYWSFAKIIWLVGILIFAVRTIKSEYTITQIIAKSSKAVSDSASAQHIFRKIQEENPRTRRIELKTCSLLNVPMIHGLRHPYILLPENIALNETELYYVLQHEAAHYLHHDLLIKIGIKIICIIYWWNPFCKALQKQAETILEMRVDWSVAKEPADKIVYLTSLKSVMEHMLQLVSPSAPHNSINSISFCDKSSPVLMQRVNMLLDDRATQFHKSIKYILILCSAILFLLSFTYIFEGNYIYPEDKIESNPVNASNSYFIDNGDGTYMFYIEDEYWGTVDSLQYFDKDIPIYKKGDEPK